MCHGAWSLGDAGSYSAASPGAWGSQLGGSASQTVVPSSAASHSIKSLTKSRCRLPLRILRRWQPRSTRSQAAIKAAALVPPILILLGILCHTVLEGLAIGLQVTAGCQGLTVFSVGGVRLLQRCRVQLQKLTDVDEACHVQHYMVVLMRTGIQH